jgi:hypothetical protein
VAKSKPTKLKKRNVVARDAKPRPGAGPMKDKKQLSRQEQKVEDRKKLEESAGQE